jgi:hypothetical protein
MFFAILLVILYFIIIYSLGYQQRQKMFLEAADLHKSSKFAIRNYLKDSTILTIDYISNPIFHDRNGCVIGCYVDSIDSFGAKRRTGFDILLQRKNKIWKSKIIKADNNLPIPRKNIKPAPWDLIFKPARKGR